MVDKRAMYINNVEVQVARQNAALARSGDNLATYINWPEPICILSSSLCHLWESAVLLVYNNTVDHLEKYHQLHMYSRQKSKVYKLIFHAVERAKPHW